MLQRPTLVIALALLPAACGSNPPATSDQPTPQPTAQPTPQPAAQPTPQPNPKPVPMPQLAGDKSGKTPERLEAEVVDQAAPPPASSESAFDSNQWNSAVGIGGRLRGAMERRRLGRIDHAGNPGHEESAESYAKVDASGYFVPAEHALSTFAADVDTASFTNVRRMLLENRLPPAGAVRVEEFVNAMMYDVPSPDPRETFGVSHEIARCPWNDEHELVRFTVSTRPIDASKVPPCNLVFLIDVSGSMSRANKLPLLQQSLDLLIKQLRPQDHVAIVTYAAGVRVPLASARGDEHARIRGAVQALRSSGGTNGEGGIQAAYEIAKKHMVPGVNRVLLATDGDFNIGISDADALETFISDKKDDGTFLTVLGFGTGNLKDDRLERLANKGNGVYTYIDSLHTARRVLVEQFGASMMTVAKDVKLQTEWSKHHVKQYRLLGYENRTMAARDFRDDKKDGGEVGAGHIVTALYEIARDEQNADVKEPLATLRIRYKPPQGDDAREIQKAITLPDEVPTQLSRTGRTAATAAALAMLLRRGPARHKLNYDLVAAMAEDIDRVRNEELVAVVKKARELARAQELAEAKTAEAAAGR